MGNENTPEGKYMSSVKVGPKGQIVIPKEARDLFNIKPGDTLLLLADVERGIAIHRLDYFNKVADHIFNGKPGEDTNEEHAKMMQFTKEESKKIVKEEEE